MKTDFRIFLALLLAIPLFFSEARAAIAAENQLQHPAGTVAHCFDGDTMKLKDRRVVRLAGIDAPELPHKDTKAQYYSRAARKILEDLARGNTVELFFPGVNIRDPHGRLVANVILPDGQSLNEAMIERGAAFFYPHQELGPDFQQRLRELQEEAIFERRGMWEHVLSLPMAKNNYVGNKASLRFFPADCPEIDKIKPRNRVDFGTLMDAFLAGYAPARICPFWPLEKE